MSDNKLKRMETRKLAAIMFTDIVGYSAIMSKDEKQAMNVLEKNREIHKSAIERFNGEYIKEIGDGTLSIFQSSFDAVSCSIEIQKACCKDPSLSVRIGIHIGDIIVKENDVFGDGVNIASRIEAAGEPGGIYISGRVYEDIKNKTDINAEFIGEKKLKNIDHPVKVYVLQQGGKTTPQVTHIPSGSSWLKKRKYPVIIIGIFVVFAILFIIYLVKSKDYLNLNENLITVAIFENQTGDESLDPVGRMASDWITQGIANTGLVSVIPSVALKTIDNIHQNMDGIRTLAKKTNAKTIITGVFYKQGNNIQFHANIVDAGEGKILIVIEPVDGPVDNPLNSIELLRQKVMGALASNFDKEFKNYSDRTLNPPLFEAYKKFLIGLDLFFKDKYDKAIIQFISAFKTDTSFYLPLIMTFHCYTNLNKYSKADSLSKVIQKHNNELSQGEKSTFEFLNATLKGDLELTFKLARLSGKHFLPHRYQSAYNALRANYPYQAIEILSSLDPKFRLFPNWYYEVLAMAYHMTRDYKKELKVAQEGRNKNPELYSALWNELKALAALGKTDDIDKRFDESLKLPVIGKQSWAPGYPGWLMFITAQELRAHGYPEEAKAAIERSVNWFLNHPEIENKSYLASAYYVAELWDESQELFEILLEEDPEQIEYMGYLGVIAARKGNRREAERISKFLIKVNRPDLYGLDVFWRARITAILDQKEIAVDLIRDAFAMGFHNWEYSILYYELMDFESLHDYPPFQELILPKE